MRVFGTDDFDFLQSVRRKAVAFEQQFVVETGFLDFGRQHRIGGQRTHTVGRQALVHNLNAYHQPAAAHIADARKFLRQPV